MHDKKSYFGGSDMNLKTYGELDLRAIREACGLDFAHYTYKPNQCSCCYGPQDLPARYWHKGIIRQDDDITYILFKNAKNCRGTVKAKNYIKNYTCISWKMSPEQLTQVCDMLQAQLGDNYIVEKPQYTWYTIIIFTVEHWACTNAAKAEFNLTDYQAQRVDEVYNSMRDSDSQLFLEEHGYEYKYYLYAQLESELRGTDANLDVLDKLREGITWDTVQYQQAVNEAAQQADE